MASGSPAGPSRWRTGTFTHAAVAGGALLAAHLARALGDLRPRSVDFSIFYIAAQGWLDGQSLYASQSWQSPLVNYNPPHFHLVVLPLAFLPLPVAFLAWTAGSGLLAWLTLRLVVRESAAGWTRRDRTILAALVLTAAGVGAALRVGQVSWLLAFIVSIAWRAARRDRWKAAGAWLGLAIGLKPFLLLFVPMLMVRGRWVAAGASLAVAAGSVLGGAAVFGWPALQSWLDLLRTPAPLHQVAYFINGSLAAVVARSTLPSVVALCGSVAVAAVTLWAASRGDEDRAWLLTIVAALLASPLGWIYYTPLLAGPLAALAHARRLPSWSWWAWPLLAFPPISREAFQQALLAVLPGSLYAWGFLVLWIAALRTSPSGAVESGSAIRDPRSGKLEAGSWEREAGSWEREAGSGEREAGSGILCRAVDSPRLKWY